MTSKRFTSILDELDYTPKKDKDLFIESRAHQVIASYVNLIRLIEESYDTETASDLQKRLILSIKNHDEERFSRKIRAMRGVREDGEL
jgi:hypothetical protein